MPSRGIARHSSDFLFAESRLPAQRGAALIKFDCSRPAGMSAITAMWVFGVASIRENAKIVGQRITIESGTHKTRRLDRTILLSSTVGAAIAGRAANDPKSTKSADCAIDYGP